MQANLEVLEGLVRRLDISVPMDQLESEVQSRLKRLARNVKMDGFRPGKAPLSAVARQHGAGLRQEVLGETLQSRFGEAVQAHQLRIAGYPRRFSRMIRLPSLERWRSPASRSRSLPPGG